MRATQIETRIDGQVGLGGIDHVAIAVKDLEAAITWYCHGLGFGVVGRRETRGRHTGMRSAVLRSGGATIVLVQGTEAASQVSRFVQHFGQGVQHIAIGVADLDQALEAVGGTSASETPVFADPGIRQVFLRRTAGSGVRVELIERRGGDFTEANITRLFQAFEDRDIY